MRGSTRSYTHICEHLHLVGMKSYSQFPFLTSLRVTYSHLFAFASISCMLCLFWTDSTCWETRGSPCINIVCELLPGKTPLEWAVTDHHYRSRAPASWPRLARRPFQVNGVASTDQPMRADGRAFLGFSSDCPMRWVPESGGSPLGTLHVQATQPRTADLTYASGAKTCMPMKKQNTARNRGHRVPYASRLPSELDPFCLAIWCANWAAGIF